MPAFDMAFMRVDRDADPMIVQGFFRTVEWPALPREGESLDIGAGLDPVTVESVGYGVDGHPHVLSVASRSTTFRWLSCASSAGA